ncbi:MAG: DUF5916 domain-containing protein [Gemmatimonadota bacterium]
MLYTALAALALGIAPDPDSIYRGTQGELEVDAPYVESPDIHIDGVASEEAWANAALLTDFTQYDPVEGIPATQRTEALVLVSGDAIYLAVRAYDDEPDGIRASIAPRDNVVRRDDYIRLTLDTFNDRRRAYVFVTNPHGVQQDGVWNEGGGGGRGGGGGGGFGPPVDYNPNFIWESEGRVEDWGYQVEIKIPFKSLRFPAAPVQSWGIQVVRRIERVGYEEAWAPISQNQPNQLSQSGQLQNLRGLDPGLFLELNPVLTGLRVGEADDVGTLVHSSADGEFGLNATYGLTSNLTLDATYNPDFSQVEADAGQIAVNERFALFFPEKRPFFLEGTDIFGMPQQLIYTRSIVNPIGGAKVTGKVGNLSLGYLGAYDEATSSDENDYARVNLLRARQDIGGNSSIGAVLTDRTESSDVFNRVGGADARFILARRYTLTMLGAFSSTQRVDDADSYAGQLWSARLERSGREFSFNASMEDSSPDFVAGSGFIRRVGNTELRSRVAWNWYGQPGATIERFGPSLQVNGIWDHDGFWNGQGWEESEIELGGSLSFLGNTSIFANYQRSGFRFPADRYEGFQVRTGPNQTLQAPFVPQAGAFEGFDQFRLNLFVGRWQAVRGRIGGTWQETPIFARGLPAEPASSWSSDNNLSIFPNPSLSIELNFRYSALFRQSTGDRYSTASISRVRAQYQLTKALFVRGIAERSYASVGDILSAAGEPVEYCADGECTLFEGGEGTDLYLEGLLSYEPSPGTVFFLGYSRAFDDEVLPEIRDLRTRADGIFLKLSYRFRF